MSRLDGTDGLEESSARQRLSQSQCRVGWSPPISRTPPGFELSAPFVFLDTTASKLLICGLFQKGRVLAQDAAGPKSHGSVLFAEWWRIYTRALTGDDEDDTLFAEAWTPEAPMETPRGLADPVLAAELFEDAVASTARRFGTWDVAWGEVHRVRRGLVDEPVGGCEGRMGCFRVLNFSEDSDGKRRVSGGDGWVLAVEFTDPVLCQNSALLK